MHTDKTLTVTIGRNVGFTPLDADRWNEFVSDTRRAVEAATTEVWVATPYKGGWHGTPEDAFVWHGQAHPDDCVVEALRQRLSTLATYYGQEGIGLAVGAGELVPAFAAAHAEGVG